MRRIIAVAGAVALALTMTACSGSSKPAESGKDGDKQVDVMTWWSAGSEKEGLDALVKVFEKQHADVKFVNKAISGGAGSQAKQKLQADLAAKNPPDTYQAHAGAELSADIKAGYLQDVSKLYDEFKLREAFPKDLVNLLTVDGKIYSIPSNVHRANVVWANPKVMEKAGLSKDNLPKDIKAWIADMEKLKAAGVAHPINVGATWTQLQLLETVLISDLGPQKYTELVSGKGDWNSAEVTTAFEDFAKIMSFTDESLYKEDWEPVMNTVVKGESAYNVMGDWAPPTFKNAKMEYGKDYITFPVPGQEKVFDFLADSFTLPVGAKHEAGAKAWLNTISSKDGQIAFNTVKGSIPARNDLSAEEIAKFSPYQQDAMKSFKEDTIVSSIAHGAALPVTVTAKMNDALGKFNSSHDVKALQADFAAAAKG